MARPRTPSGRAPSGGTGTLPRRRPFLVAADVIALARHSRKELAADADADVLAGRLTVAAEEFIALSRREAQERPGEDAKRAREVERQARALLGAFGLRDDHERLSPELVYA